MPNDKSKLIYWIAGIMATIIILLIGALWATTIINQATRIGIVETNLKDHEDKQIEWQLKDMEIKTSIDNRLANLEKVAGINGYKK